MPRRRSGAERLRSALLWWTGIALAVLIWHAAARTQPQYVLPGPRTTWTALLGLIRDEELGAPRSCSPSSAAPSDSASPA
jgi:hypothetical protein